MILSSFWRKPKVHEIGRSWTYSSGDTKTCQVQSRDNHTHPKKIEYANSICARDNNRFKIKIYLTCQCQF